jgi:signal transduction histidine kinase/ActR/RegA family two-component response regulator
MPAARGLKQALPYLWVAGVVLVLGLGATAAVTLQLRETIESRDRDRFGGAVNALHDDITTRLSAYIAMLQAGAGMFAAQPDTTREQFHAFVERLRLPSLYPGTQGIGFSRRAAPQDLPALVAAQRRAGFPAFRVWPEEPREEYHSIVYLEPLDRRNQAAIGYDMYTDPTRRAAMERARDQATPAASGPVTLVQEIEGAKQPGFLIYVPVYRGGGVPPTLEERRATLMGFVYSPFRAGDLFTGVFGSDPRPRVGFSLLDGDPRNGNLLYRSQEALPGSPRFTTQRQIDLAGRIWTIQYFSAPGLEWASSRDLVPLAAAAGTLASVLLAFLTALQGRARHRAERSEAALRAQTVVLERLNESERASRAEAERVSRLKDEFLATVSHELRTPLNAVIGWIHLLRDAKLSGGDRKKALLTIERNARVQAQLIEDLLDMSRIASGHARLDYHPVDLAEVVDAAVRMVQPSAAAKGVTLDTHLDSELPLLKADPSRLQQIAWNLLTNAIKFTPSGGRVDITVRRAAESLELVVTDTGIGVTPEFLPYMFDRFRQADASSTRHHGGLGLGLSIVKSLAEIHGGTVRAESPGPNRGTTVVVSLPGSLALSPLAEGPAPEDAAAPAYVPLDVLSGARVLVIDDDGDAREVVQSLLGARGAEVTVAAGSDEALERLTVGPRFDLLVSDLGMPQIDGFEFLRRVRALPAERGTVPALALTAYARPQDRDHALRAGYQVHIAKPLDPGHFLAACARLLHDSAAAN